MNYFHKEFNIHGIPYFINQDMDAPEPIPVQVLADDIDNLKAELAAAKTLIEVLQDDLPDEEVESSEVSDEDLQALLGVPKYNYLGEPIQ